MGAGPTFYDCLVQVAPDAQAIQPSSDT
jgi:hypothetical protein